MSSQETVKHFNLEYALWALLLGLIISNTHWYAALDAASATNRIVRQVGPCDLGCRVLLHRLLALGLPGICVAWVVTPIVLITTYWFGQKVLKISSPSLNMVISADMSVCGVSAAIATAASCKAKKEELSFAIGISLIFTVIMMVAMPIAVRALGLSSTVGGAWIGGTIDSTGAVVAAGAALDSVAEETAATVKMIQNILIGVTAFGVAVYWVTFVERDPDGARPQVSEIWSRFPKFVLGFAAASIAATLVSRLVTGGDELVDATVTGATTTVRSWFSVLRLFVSDYKLGLRTTPNILSAKPVALYLCGQALNLILTLAMAQLMFGVLFAESIKNANQEPASNAATQSSIKATPEPILGTLPKKELVELTEPK